MLAIHSILAYGGLNYNKKKRKTNVTKRICKPVPIRLHRGQMYIFVWFTTVNL